MAAARSGGCLRCGGTATWPSRRSGWRRSAIFARSRGATPIRRPRRVRSIAVATASSWARGASRSCSSGPRVPGGGVRHAYAEVAGCGSSSDAHHHVIPSPDPAPAAAAMRQALADARIEPGEVDHVNAHATSTPVGDAAEAAVLRLVLGDDAGRIPVTSTKSLTGHMLTAAGAFEALACLTAIRHQAIPPTINLDEPDVDLCLVANEARPHPVRIAVSNSFGFGGSNTSLVLRGGVRSRNEEANALDSGGEKPGRVAIVTGASSGIGRALAFSWGVGLSRRADRPASAS